VSEIVPAEPTELAAKLASEVDQRIKLTVRNMRRLWLDLAKDLYFFQRGELWRDLGYSSFEQWLAEPDISLDRRWVYQLKTIYQQLVVEREVPMDRLARINVTAVGEVLPAIRRQYVTLDEGLSDAETLVSSDLRIRYRGLVGGQQGLSTGGSGDVWDAEAEPAWAICPHCGSRYQTRS
jgi:hypothetical protein